MDEFRDRSEKKRAEGVRTIDSFRDAGDRAFWRTRSVPSFASVTCDSHPKCLHTRSKGQFGDKMRSLHHVCVAPSGTKGFTHFRQQNMRKGASGTEDKGLKGSY